MSMTNAQILTEVNARTNRAETDISTIRNAVLTDLSMAWNFLEKTSSVTVSAAAQSAALPSGCIKVKSVTDSSGKVLQPVSIEELLNFQAVNPATGVARKWSQHNDSLYVYPAPTSETTYTAYHSYESVDVDDFDDCFDEAIVEGCCFKLYESLGLLGELPAAQTHLELYRAQLETLKQRFSDRGA